MADWDEKERPEAFCNVPLAEVVGRVSGLIERYRPQVVVSYESGSLGALPRKACSTAPASSAARPRRVGA